MENRFDDSRRIFVKRTVMAVAAGSISLPNSLSLAEETPKGSLMEGEAWLNEPKGWRKDGATIICTADPKTDFWRKTFYGYITDNGHFLYRRVKGDFSTTVKVSGAYHDLYDQAGLMVRVDESNWMKCGVEMVDGKQYLSVVFTRDFSDWSTARLPKGTGSVWMRVVKKGASLDIFYSLDGKEFVECRMGYFAPAETVMAGPMCAAPEGKGFEARFEEWIVQANS